MIEGPQRLITNYYRGQPCCHVPTATTVVSPLLLCLSVPSLVTEHTDSGYRLLRNSWDTDRCRAAYSSSTTTALHAVLPISFVAVRNSMVLCCGLLCHFYIKHAVLPLQQTSRGHVIVASPLAYVNIVKKGDTQSRLAS